MSSLSTPATLADAVFPVPQVDRRVARIAREAILTVGFAWFVALCAQIAVGLPWTTVPITGQTFAVLFTGGALGAWRGASSLSVYMVMGIIGIPVFAPGGAVTPEAWDVHFILSSNGSWDGTSEYIWNLSGGGYIVGFILAAGLVGYLSDQQWDRKPWVHLGMFAGNVVLYIPGLLWLAYLIGTDWVHPVGKPLGDLIAGSDTWDKTLKGGLYPFIVGDMMKLFLASLTLPLGWAIVNRWKNGDTRNRGGDRPWK